MRIWNQVADIAAESAPLHTSSIWWQARSWNTNRHSGLDEDCKTVIILLQALAACHCWDFPFCLCESLGFWPKWSSRFGHSLRGEPSLNCFQLFSVAMLLHAPKGGLGFDHSSNWTIKGGLCLCVCVCHSVCVCVSAARAWCIKVDHHSLLTDDLKELKE